MKRFLVLACAALAALALNGQKPTFVLVDVSKSVKTNDLVGAKQALLEVLSGAPLSNGAQVSGGNPQDIQPFKLSAGDKLSISKFGDQQTTLSIVPQLVVINSLPADIYNALGAFPITPTDDRTYWKLAKAKLAEYAKNNGIKNYRLCVVSDENEDDFGGGKPDYKDNYILELAEGYNTANNPAIEAPSVLVKVRTNTQGFKLNFCSNIDISKYTPPTTPIQPQPGGTTVTPPSTDATITLLSPAKPQRGKQTEMKSENVNVNWSCENCPQGTRYTVTVSGIEGTKYHDTKKDLATSTVVFKLSDGKYRITVSASNATGSDFTAISVSSGGGGGIIALVIFLAAACAGYFFWDRSRKKKADPFESGKHDDMFKGNKGVGSGPSSNSSNDIF